MLQLQCLETSVSVSPFDLTWFWSVHACYACINYIQSLSKTLAL